MLSTSSIHPQHTTQKLLIFFLKTKCYFMNICFVEVNWFCYVWLLKEQITKELKVHEYDTLQVQEVLPFIMLLVGAMLIVVRCGVFLFTLWNFLRSLAAYCVLIFLHDFSYWLPEVPVLQQKMLMGTSVIHHKSVGNFSNSITWCFLYHVFLAKWEEYWCSNPVVHH